MPSSSLQNTRHHLPFSPPSFTFRVSAPGRLMAGHYGLVLAFAGKPGGMGRAHPGHDRSGICPTPVKPDDKSFQKCAIVLRHVS